MISKVVKNLLDMHYMGYRSTSDEVWRPESGICMECSKPWPCDVVEMYRELTNEGEIK